MHGLTNVRKIFSKKVMITPNTQTHFLFDAITHAAYKHAAIATVMARIKFYGSSVNIQ